MKQIKLNDKVGPRYPAARGGRRTDYQDKRALGMSEETAKQILNVWIQTDNSLFGSIKGLEEITWVKILWTPGDTKLSMRGNFTPEQIEAIAWWITHKN